VAAGDQQAVEQLTLLVYDELRALAHSYLRVRGRRGTLQTTALVHDAFVRLLERTEAEWQSRAHFFAVAAKAMRQILSNHARDMRAAKRGGGWARIALSQVNVASPQRELDVVLLDELLTRLTELDERQSRIVELRFFSGMTVPEIAHVLGVSTSTVEREWRAARAWLSSELRKGEEP
jgi:RNA polymerase sigma factor (TIGR02999 family)